MNNDVYSIFELKIAFWNGGQHFVWKNEPFGITIDFRNKRLLTFLK